MIWFVGTCIAIAIVLGAFHLGRSFSGSEASPSPDTEPDSERRSFLGLAGGGVASAVGVWALSDAARADEPKTTPPDSDDETYTTSTTGGAAESDHYPDSFKGLMSTKGSVDHETNGFDPMQMLVDWNTGDEIEDLGDGRKLRKYHWKAVDKEIEVAPGVYFPAWTYEGRVPGPTIRCREGDRIQIHFQNAGSHPHTIHFHGIHPFEMDGVPGAGPGEIAPGESFTYEFDAKPYGCHLYHCHSIPLKRHIHKGLYGAFIVDPKEGRPPARELMMVMNGFDTDFDGDNEIYAANSVAFEYARRHIPAKLGETIRIYLINTLEFDAINSFHSHAEFFDYYDHGTSLEPDRTMIDTVMFSQAQRGIIELSYNEPGHFMFHAHQSEFAELGWMAKFNIVEPGDFQEALEAAGVGPEWDRRATEGILT